jgi:Rv0623-like transcription factor
VRTVKDQIHIRNAEAAQLVRALARQTGKTMSSVMLEALRQYRPRAQPQGSQRIERWRRLLQEDLEGLIQPEIPVEALYDEATGLPS